MEQYLPLTSLVGGKNVPSEANSETDHSRDRCAYPDK